MDTTLTDRPPIGPFSLDEFLSWEGEPDVRYELVDGWAYAMTRAARAHARAVQHLQRVLLGAVPPGHELLAEFGWVLHPGQPNVRIPDVSIGPIEDDDGAYGWSGSAILLAIEVLSPDSRRRDLVQKRAAYAAAGLRHYWVVDPDPAAPSITAFSGEGLFHTIEVTGDDPFEVTEPFPVRLVPSELLKPAR